MSDKTQLSLFRVLVVFLGLVCMLQMCGDDEPEDDEGSAVLCDYLCISDEKNGRNTCEWYCEDPELEVACNYCDYEIRSGNAVFRCTQCDVGTY